MSEIFEWENPPPPKKKPQTNKAQKLRLLKLLFLEKKMNRDHQTLQITSNTRLKYHILYVYD